MQAIAISDARRDIADLVDRVKYKGERLILSKSGRNVAALVSVDDLMALEAMQDRIDTETAERRLDDSSDRVIAFRPSRRARK